MEQSENKEQKANMCYVLRREGVHKLIDSFAYHFRIPFL